MLLKYFSVCVSVFALVVKVQKSKLDFINGEAVGKW